ncbi:MAG: alpha/beta hydrolase [Solirubrobacterales bacterium]
MAARISLRAGDGAVLAGERWIGGEPVVVLLHAGVTDRRAWKAVATELDRQGRDVIAYDRRGFGETRAQPDGSGLDDLRAVLTQAAEGPAWLVGNSQGGELALDMALAEPSLLAGLVLIAPAVSGAPEPEDSDLDPATLEIGAAIEAAAADGDLAAVNRLEVRLWLDGPASPEGRVSGAARDLALEMNAIALTSHRDAEPRSGLGAWDRLAEVTVPTTLVCGELDIPLMLERCRLVAGRLPNARPPVELPGVAHLPGLEDPGAVARMIDEAIEA